MPRVITKKSVVPGKVPLPTDLEVGELAVNTADAKLYTKHNDNTIKVIGGSGGGSGDVAGPSSSTADRVAVFADSTGKVIKEATFFDSPTVGIPPAPSLNNLRWFARSRAGRVLPHVLGPSGVDLALQPALFGSTVYMWLPGSGDTLAINFGTSFTARNSGIGAGQDHPAKSSTNAITSLNRATFSTGITSTGSSGIQSSATVAWRGNAANLGGFFFFARFGIETLVAGQQVLIGLSALNAAITGEPSAVNNTIAIGKDSGDNTWQLITRNTSAVTKIDTGCTVTAGQVLDFIVFAPSNGEDVTFRLVDAVTGTVYVDNLAVSTDLPDKTVFMYMHAQTRSTSGTTALALNRMYLETDL
jgi:hypothetical protein